MITFPPILESSQPAFVPSSYYRIYFTTQEGLEYGNVQAKIVSARTNQSIVNSNIYPDQIVYKFNPGKNYIDITNEDVTWETGSYYKVQLRFGSKTSGWDSDFYLWKRDNDSSEWSSAMMLKPIAEPDIRIVNKVNLIPEGEIFTPLYIQGTETSTTPLFVGRYSCGTASENLKSYKFDLYDIEENFIESSGWLQANNAESAKTSETISVTTKHRFSQVLDEDEEYILKYYIVTENGYENSEPAVYFFNIRIESEQVIQNLIVFSEVEEDNALVKVAIKPALGAAITLNGNYIVNRINEYGLVEDLKYIQFNNKTLSQEEEIYKDFTVENGKSYKYDLVKVKANGVRTALTGTDTEKTVYFTNSYLYAQGYQLSLEFNNNMDSFKHVQLSAKQDTIGGKYPFIFKNGYTNYATFPINALITLHSNKYFLNEDINGDLYYKDKKVISNSLLTGWNEAELNTYNTFNQDLTNKNIRAEKIYRDCVEDFLLNTDYFLFKSATEGNFIISITNVGMSPITALGRMLYNFNAEAYEVMENTRENLNKFGIDPSGEYIDLNAEETHSVSFGQVLLDNSRKNAIELIKAEEKTETLEYKKLKSFYLEPLESEEDINYDIELVYVTGAVQQIRLSKARVYSVTNVDLAGIFVHNSLPLLVGYTCYVGDIEINDSPIIVGASTITVSYWDQIAQELSANQSFYSYIQNQFEQNFKRIYGIPSAATQTLEDGYVTFIVQDGEVKYKYKINEINKLEIETSSFSNIIIEDEPIVIGSTGVYNIEGSKTDKAFVENNQYAILNYKCEAEIRKEEIR